MAYNCDILVFNFVHSEEHLDLEGKKKGIKWRLKIKSTPATLKTSPVELYSIAISRDAVLLICSKIHMTGKLAWIWEPRKEATPGMEGGRSAIFNDLPLRMKSFPASSFAARFSTALLSAFVSEISAPRLAGFQPIHPCN